VYCLAFTLAFISLLLMEQVKIYSRSRSPLCSNHLQPLLLSYFFLFGHCCLLLISLYYVVDTFTITIVW